MENFEAFHYTISSSTEFVFLKRRLEILIHPNIYNIHYIYTLNDLVKEQLHISKVELIGENFFPLAETFSRLSHQVVAFKDATTSTS